jgi:hypothetical protein
MTLTPLQLTERSHATRRALNDAINWIEQDRKHCEPDSNVDYRLADAAYHVAEAITALDLATRFPHQPRKEQTS